MFVRPVLALSLLVLSGVYEQQKDEPHLSKRGAPQFLLKISTSQLTVNGQSTQACVIIYPDESFRFEKRTRRIGHESGTTFVGGEHLSEADAARAKKILQDEHIAMLDDSAVRRGGFPFQKELRLVYAAIPRENNRVQSIAAVSADTKPLDPGAETLLSFIQAIEATQPAVLAGASPNNCREPRAAKALPD